MGTDTKGKKKEREGERETVEITHVLDPGSHTRLLCCGRPKLHSAAEAEISSHRPAGVSRSRGLGVHGPVPD